MTTNNRQALIVTRQARADAINVIGEDVTVLLDTARSPGLEVFVQRGDDGIGPPPHTHPWDETYYVLEGEVCVTLADEDGNTYDTNARAGDFVFVPGGTPHGYRNVGPAMILTLCSGDEVRAAKMYQQLGGVAPGPELIERAAGVGAHFLPAPDAG